MKADKVLIVDDDPRVRDVLEQFLGPRYDVRAVENAMRAFAEIVREPPDVLLLDMQLPTVGGRDLLLALQDMDVRFPVIVITGDESLVLAEEVLRLGIFSYVPKPFDLHYVDHLIASALERRKWKR